VNIILEGINREFTIWWTYLDDRPKDKLDLITAMHAVGQIYREGARKIMCTLFDNTREVAWTGFAQCSSSDHFSKPAGRKISLTRALANSDIDKPIRTKIWKEVAKTSPKTLRCSVGHIQTRGSKSED